ncbi:MAG: DUF1156 domain-containing protein [Caldilineaceae bacterium]|nr:DUF1156 domain-containing protein [Caldilineaceae bacterium]
MTTNDKRLIEVEFPLKQTSLDSVHEKNVRHGHISTLHIWPARRPLAAARAALIATLLPDPGDAEKRKEVLERMAGRVVEKVERRRVNGRPVEKVKEETVGGILHWGRENEPDLQWFRDEIRKAYGGRAPKVLDPFAGGGAIPLEAMRLGCEVTAMDINPVAWFILKCTLEYPQRLAGQTRPLPEFALRDGELMEAFLKSRGFKGASLRTMLERLGHGESETQLGFLSQEDPIFEADLAWQVRAWGRWVLARARKQLASYYPTYAEFVPLAPTSEDGPPPMQLLEVDAEGVPQLDPLNVEFEEDYLKDPRNPRWIAKPTVAYLWARTVTCKQCRATLPLLKTRWLCKKERKRVLLKMEPNTERSGVVFDVEADVPSVGGNAAQRREHDRRVGGGTMSRTGATCPCCSGIMTMEDIRLEGRAGRLGAAMTAVVVDGMKGKEYRLPTEHELSVAEVTEEQLQALYADIPFGLPEEPTPKAGSGASRAFSVDGYGFDTWRKLFTNRQLLAIGAFIGHIRSIPTIGVLRDDSEWGIATTLMLSACLDRAINYMSTLCLWESVATEVKQTFLRFALPITWDFAEGNPLSTVDRFFAGGITNVGRTLDSLGKAGPQDGISPKVLCQSAIVPIEKHDLVVTDPPYYDAIPYSDLMDFFYVWLRRTLHGLSTEFDRSFKESLGPKWNGIDNDGELIDDSSRFDGDRQRSKSNYEDGMFRAFKACGLALTEAGYLVVVFANKQPDAWETLVSAVIRAGFAVDASWPIVTEMRGGVRNYGRASLASSIWLVCRKRQSPRPGWDSNVLQEMRANITQKLHEFWDAGIRGPDFVWAATGPALEAFSKYPVVKKANDPNELMNVSEFLREVRRMVVDFVVGRVLSQEGEESVTGLDDVTTYYLLHRHDFGVGEAPVGGCILYALSCNLSDAALVNQHDLLARGRGRGGNDEDGANGEQEGESGSGGGATVRLKPWHRRTGRNLGLQDAGGRPAPLIDQAHRLMQLWQGGDQVKVNSYLDERGLQRNALFAQILQALIELAEAGSDERSILEALSNHVKTRGNVSPSRQGRFALA